MNSAVKKVLSIAEAEIGYLNKGTNANLDDKLANPSSSDSPPYKYTKYARDLYEAGYYNGNKNGYHWCDVFVDWLFYKLCNEDKEKAEHIICQTGDCGAVCGYSLEYYQKANRFYTNTPKPGDQIFFVNPGDNLDNSYHTGIVYKVDDTMVHTIEGNTWSYGAPCSGVFIRDYFLNNPSIGGYGRPRFEDITIASDNFFSIEIKSVSATKATVCININQAEDEEPIDLESYIWNGFIADRTSDIMNIIDVSATNLNDITITNLNPGAPYILNISARNEHTSVSQQVFFSTDYDHPNKVTQLNIIFSSNPVLDKTCQIMFKSPTSWGNTKATSNGYRISLIVNGQILSYIDNLVTTECTTFSLESFTKKDRIDYNDLLQIGIQTWVINKAGDKIFDSSAPMCSQPVYLKYFLDSVDKLYIKTLEGFKQTLLLSPSKML